MSQTTVNLGYVPKNRGEYSSTASYYKDNIVQYNGSSYICNPPNYDPDTAPTASITGVAPYASDPATPNTGWAVFCNDSSGVGEGVYDVSVDHTTDNQPKKYTDLSAALLDVPTAKQKGGMTIRFIQSSDNKYVQYRLMADEWSVNTEDWAIAEEGVYVESPEFVYVKTDKDGKILWAIKTDGGIYYGAGVPQQVIDYIEEKIADLSLDEYEDIVAFLNGLEKGDKTLQTLLSEKVDKEEGKSLIDEEYASGVYQIESPEFIEVKLDEQERIIEATQKDGTKLFGGNVKVEDDLDVNGDIESKGAIITTINNPEFIAVWVTSDNKILFGVQKDGNFLFGCGIPSQITSLVGTTSGKIAALEQYMKETYGEMIESPEWLKVLADAEDKVIEGIKVDGTKEVNTDVTLNGSLNHQGVVTEVTDNPEYLEAKVDSEGRLIEGINRNGEKIFGVIPPQIKQYIDENMPAGGSGVSSIEYDEETGDMYATYDDEGGITDVSMEPNGDIYVEYEE